MSISPEAQQCLNWIKANKKWNTPLKELAKEFDATSPTSQGEKCITELRTLTDVFKVSGKQRKKLVEKLSKTQSPQLLERRQQPTISDHFSQLRPIEPSEISDSTSDKVWSGQSVCCDCDHVTLCTVVVLTGSISLYVHFEQTVTRAVTEQSHSCKPCTSKYVEGIWTFWWVREYDEYRHPWMWTGIELIHRSRDTLILTLCRRNCHDWWGSRQFRPLHVSERQWTIFSHHRRGSGASVEPFFIFLQLVSSSPSLQCRRFVPGCRKVKHNRGGSGKLSDSVSRFRNKSMHWPRSVNVRLCGLSSFNISISCFSKCVCLHRCALVLHFDEGGGTPCEATGLQQGSGLRPLDMALLPKITVLVSPCNLKERTKFYGER